MATVALERVEKRYPNGHVAVRDLSLEIADGELLVLVGPSGSGKSTVLRIIAGLESPTDGRIRLGDRDVTALPPQDRDVAMVFQSYALYPHMSVRENMAFGLRVRGRPRAEITRRVDEVARSLGLAELLGRRPAQLSGGQRQRVALGRAIVREPCAFLFDEPLSNLDAQLRTGTRAELARLHQRLGATMVYVTHDQVEAMTLGERVAVLDRGVLQQVAPPEALYRRPANRFVAGFIGSPPMNFVRARLEIEGGACTAAVRSSTIRVNCPRAAVAERDVVLGVRPHDLAVRDAPDALRLPVTLVERLGSEQIVHLALATNEELLLVLPERRRIAIGEVLPVHLPPDAVHLFGGQTGERLS